MALLIALGIVGGLTTLAALYVIGTYIVASIVGHTHLFKDKVTAVIEDYKARRKAKKDAKAQKLQETAEIEEVK